MPQNLRNNFLFLIFLIFSVFLGYTAATYWQSSEKEIKSGMEIKNGF